MVYKGHIEGNVVVLDEPPRVPEGTEVEIFVPETETVSDEDQGNRSVTRKTFGLIPSDPATVRAVIEEDLYET